ncbi:MAG: hypothetical protein LBR80_14115 [Deltaproteobacteria bacterium]|jgi:hypothetical protein|nr:hypothetical protein [Deltaproteobacteria bacterium]
MSKSTKPDPELDDVLSAACRLQAILPGTGVVGGTAAPIHARHPVSFDADHVLPDLRQNFREILDRLESVAGWHTNRTGEPVIILGSLDGIETGVRQLIMTEPLETIDLDVRGSTLTVPTLAKILRVKAVVVLKRNATRDYLDFAALAERLGTEQSADALESFDRLNPQKSGESALQQLLVQLSDPLQFVLEKTELVLYKNPSSRRQDWGNQTAGLGKPDGRIGETWLNPLKFHRSPFSISYATGIWSIRPCWPDNGIAP